MAKNIEMSAKSMIYGIKQMCSKCHSYPAMTEPDFESERRIVVTENKRTKQGPTIFYEQKVCNHGLCYYCNMKRLRELGEIERAEERKHRYDR
jgi:hypothetical protein